jgi:hypothetical protein
MAFAIGDDLLSVGSRVLFVEASSPPQVPLTIPNRRRPARREPAFLQPAAAILRRAGANVAKNQGFSTPLRKIRRIFPKDL